MTSGIDKSPKLIFNEFQKSITEVPLDVFYQNITCDQFNTSGFQFNIKQPGSRALLDPDIWISYKIYVRETTAGAIEGMFENGASAPSPNNTNRLALRSGYCLWRCMQNFSLQINNTTVTVQPYKWVDVLNRLYVSNTQSQHEFSMSGGEFDSGNHGIKTSHIRYIAQRAGIDNPTTAGVNTLTAALQSNAALLPGFYVNPSAPTTTTNGVIQCVMRPPYPLIYEFMNPGFSRRFEQFAAKCRDAAGNATQASTTGTQFFPRIDGSTVKTVDGVPDLKAYMFTLYERLPIPLFKMYSNDAVYGVIPNVTQMQIQANFMSKFTENFLRGTNQNDPNLVPAVTIDFNDLPERPCTLYLRWYTPPQNMVIPRELSIPYPKIVAWSKTMPNAAGFATDATKIYAGASIDEYNITLESIPDLLLIYIKYNNFKYALYSPDDYLMEINTLYINIDSSSGKLNQIQTIDLYNKWKKILKHSDSDILKFDEWRKYCCVACLQPDDYGVRFGPGYSNQTVLGVKIDYTNWWNIPTINWAPVETYESDNVELCVTSIYNRNRLVIRSDGSAAQDMLKVAADFNMTPTPVMEEMDVRGRLNI